MSVEVAKWAAFYHLEKLSYRAARLKPGLSDSSWRGVSLPPWDVTVDQEFAGDALPA